MVILTENTMQKECAITVITSMAEQKNLGIVLMISFMLMECVRIATLIPTIEKEGKKKMKKNMKMDKFKVY